ncbi:RHS repeat domain-containing protein [Oligosphaera ethanolica]|uniref:RHS repeat-associated protein n=1 Tax=Oligosphaera ethanolica TaxID=760260 RepID=A0AAE4AN61_9BACT|nr:RHS repeat-associated core domain-containing protein [Oligosphaera ethanolica]MDQ0287997.1 RHS repeat-associated protein [Oligosphaera ethanolica]
MASEGWMMNAPKRRYTLRFADGHGPTYTYTLDGKLATRTWARTDANANPLTTTYSYDSATGELISIDYADNTPDISYTYTRTGQPATVTDVVGTRTFAYDAQLQDVSETIVGLYNKTLTRSTTTTGMKGRKLGLAIDGVPNYSYGYDMHGRLNQISTPAGDFDYTRLANSDLVSQMTRPNGVTTTWTYEQSRDLITQVQNGAISTYGYTNDAIGRRTSMSRAGSAHPTPDIITYTYNDRSEVTGAVSNVDASYTYAYAYDPIGNRISANEAGVPWTYTANQLNQYTAMTEGQAQMVPTYDLDGSMTYRPVDATSGWVQIWNGENRMVETTKGTDRLEFKYDYMGRRVEKKVYDDQTLTTHLKFVYDGFKLVEELDGLNGGVPLRRYAWQPDDVGLDVVLQMTDVPNAAHSFHLHDANKNVMQVTDGNGLIASSNSFSPYGINNIIPPHQFGFSSEKKDIETNLVYYNYRYYSLLGRWLSHDPIDEISFKKTYSFENDSYNNFTLVNMNDCINRFDKLGLTSRWKEPEELLCDGLDGIAKALCKCAIKLVMKLPEARVSKCVYAFQSCIWLCQMDFDQENQKDELNKCNEDCKYNYGKCLLK